jgi:hypothetical protein
LQGEAILYFRREEVALANRDMISEHALGEAMTANVFEKVARYEVHLDRKLERMLAMLLKLQDLRRTANPA